MNVSFKWSKILSIGYLHKRIFFFSLIFFLIVLSLDCAFQTLPISGYGLTIIILIFIGFTTCATCHGIKWIINATKPLQFHLSEKGQNGKWLKLIMKFEEDVFKKIFNNDNKFESFKYPTNFNEQIRLLLKDIEKDFVKTWYAEISQNPSFLFDSHLILEEIFFKLTKKLKTINCKNIILSILILYLKHLQEYKKAVKKMVRLNEVDSKPKIELPDLCRYSHPGSQNYEVLNYYLKKISKSLLKEFTPHDFADSLECKILAGIIGRKCFRRFLTVVEDPNWINLKLIYMMNPGRHKEILGDKVYIVKEKFVIKEEEFQFKKPVLMSKNILTSNLFDASRNLFDRNEFQNGANGRMTENEKPKSKVPDKESLTLALHNTKIPFGETKGNISTVLSGLISSTAGPLLPDHFSVRYQALNKMWQSPVAEVKKDISESISNSFRKVFDGIKEKKGMTRSKSTEFLADATGSLKSKDISVGEELCENIRFGSTDLSNGSHKTKKLTKTRSFDSDSLTMEDVTCEDLKDLGEKSSSPRQQGDVSPVYEEPEDFATTIAKLRSLLQQRESSSTLSDKSNASIDSHSVGYSLDKSDSSNKSQSLEGDSFDSQIPNDIPTDGRIFMNISIPKGELVTDSSGSTYVLYTIQYDGIYMLKDEHNASSDPELVLQTTFVKRRFQEFLQLQSKLEENSQYRAIIKGIKGPSKWLQMSGKIDESSTASRRAHLESFLRQLCSKVEISHSPEVHEFLGYGQKGSDVFVKKNNENSLQRIDKLLANKVTGVFNSIKTALPSFDFDSTALVATNDTVKNFQEQKLLQGFLNFGNKPECFELNLNFAIREPTGESLADDIRHFFNDKSDCVEHAVDVLDSNDWMSEQRECIFLAEEKCVWHGHKDYVLDDELEPLDSILPVYSLLLDILCELLQDSDCWIIKESVIRVAKVALGHWEQKFEKELLELDWDRFFANIVRLIRASVFQSQENDCADPNQEETREVLKEVILESIPEWIMEFIQPDGVSSAVSLFVDSLQHLQLNRDVLLRLMDILLAHLLSCPHLTENN